MRLLLCGGGTAGHINPAISIAKELEKEDAASEILFIGRRAGDENGLISKAGYKLKTIEICGIKRSLSAKNIAILIKAVKSVKEAEKIIKEFKPDVILGTGGYVCWPVIRAGKKHSIPCAIHESNAIPGLTTKLLSKICNVIFLNYESARKYFNKKAKALTVGNPISQSFYNIKRSDARKRLRLTNDDFFILSFGGSIGADKLNKVMLEVIKSYSSKEEKLYHLHATGNRFFNEYRNEKTLGNTEMRPYIDNMPEYMCAADLVICRCGASTLTELCAVGVASILIPSPNVSANHQYYNALAMKEAGAAIVIEEDKLSQNVIISAIKQLKNDKFDRKTRAKKSKALYFPDSAKTIVKELKKLKNNSKKTVN